ncbi:PIN domain-containing protein [Kibdelosporangium persicum]|uniref:Nucleic-acid-binding protein, contains PIN domain n=1 Tax=Kibdelosporangium persicum TaxID=2698649 RepID=A0ABX2F8Y2_9PSEU|nr:PIN domain-containing protein [Kibdelosporangium persicum]NRN67717.1 putative nucleic-acid-binding protein, contains PIN domain [Kibdelosporangium persicum]
MTGAIPELVFIDTNVLVYAHDGRDPVKNKIAKAALTELWDTDTGALSTQVLQEFYSVAIRKLDLPHDRAREIVSVYGEWCATTTDAQLLVSASVLCERYQLSWWDALVVEAALRCGATTLLSEDLQDGQTFGSLTIRNPFVEN